MKILKSPHHSPMFLPLALAGRMRLACTVMVWFDLDDPENPLPDREMWPQVAKLLPQPPVLDPGLPKPRGEVLAAGACFAPKGETRQAAQVRVSVGGMSKTLDVFGDRHWLTAAGGAVGLSDPQPFTRMSLNWEHAFGGAADPRNPKGRGLPPGGSADAPLPLPNVEYPGQLMGSPADRPAPAGYLPREVTHPERTARAGTYDETWKNERWPYYPDDLNPEFFLAAPEDQWLPGFLQGGEAIEALNMHPTRQVVSSNVPRFSVRLFLTRKQAPKAPPEQDTFEEVPLRRDTLWLFPEVARGVLIFRGLCDTARDDMADLRCVYLATEAAGTKPQTLEQHLEAQNRQLAAMKPVPPVLPDVNALVNRELLKFNRVHKEVALARAKALGQAPVMPRGFDALATMGQQLLAGGLATLGKIEAASGALRQRFGWQAGPDQATLAAKRASLEAGAAKADASAAHVAEGAAKMNAMRDSLAKDAGQRLKASLTGEQLDKAGLNPDNLLPSKEDDFGPWHAQGFPFVVRCRMALERMPEIMAALASRGLSTRTVAHAWIGCNPEPVEEDAQAWGLPPGGFTLPAGLVLPRFAGRTLVGIVILPGWPGARGEAVAAPGSKEEPLWLPAHWDAAPALLAGSDLEAILLEQELGDVCHVLALAPKDAAPPPEAAAILKAAPEALATTPAGPRENLSEASPHLAAAPRARWLCLPKGADCLEARMQGVDLRTLVLDALPPAAVGLPEQEEAPAYGPAPAAKRPAMPDIGALIAASHGEIKAAYEARMDGLKQSMGALEAKARQTLAEHGKDFDQITAETKAAPRLPFDQMGKKMAADILGKRDALKAQGVLSPEAEADMAGAAANAEKLGTEAEARWQAGSAQLAAAAAKTEATKASRQGALPEDMAARFRAAGMDPEARKPKTREQVVALHAAGQSLAGSNLSGVDLSGLDLTGADFSGCALAGAKFAASRLDGCSFVRTSANNADFSEASLRGARFDQALLGRASFRKAVLAGASLRQAGFKRADLSGADLSGAQMHMASVNACNLAGTVFAGARLSLMAVQRSPAPGAVFRDARLERVQVRGSDLTGADFSGATFVSSQLQQCQGAKLTLAGAVFEKGAIAECELPGCDFTGVVARRLSVRNANLSGADFRKARLTNCRVEGSDLTRARMSGVSARGTAFPGTDLERANLRGADLLGGSLAKARIVEADIRDANCFGVDFHKAVVGNTRLDRTNLVMTVLHGRTEGLE